LYEFEATTAVMAAALVAARAMAAERPNCADGPREVDGSSAEPRRPWKISREEFCIVPEKKVKIYVCGWKFLKR